MRRLLPFCLYLAACGDSPAVSSTDLVLRNATDRIGAAEDLQAFEAYLVAAGAAGVSPPALDRIDRLN